MYLINVSTLKLEEFVDVWSAPPYAILSHRWEQDEVTYKDMTKGFSQKRKGFAKIMLCAEQAKKDNLSHAWVDTCCIDKRSSAELSEAINSMYRWYQNASVCYAYLSDIQPMDTVLLGLSAWFTRGWTLQELIAPKKLLFFNCEWSFIGSRLDLVEKISKITRIPVGILNGSFPPSHYSIAQRMSWAARRTTTRVEDMAYSLLGLFNVNMPLLYGEGKNAFIRLQEEIIKRSDDHSIFAWPGASGFGLDSEFNTFLEVTSGGLLAENPDYFWDCNNIAQDRSRGQRKQDYSFTNVGLSISLPLIPWAMDTYVAILNCQIYGGSGPADRLNQTSTAYGIFLRRQQDEGQYVRVAIGKRHIYTTDIHKIHQSLQVRVNVRQEIRQSLQFPVSEPLYGFEIHFDPVLERSRFDRRVYCHNRWDPSTKVAELPLGKWGTVAVVELVDAMSRDLRTLIKLGFDFDFNPILQIHEKSMPLSVTESQLQDILSNMWIKAIQRDLPSREDNEMWSPKDMRDVSKDPYNLDSMSRRLPRVDDRVWTEHGDRFYGLQCLLEELNGMIVMERHNSRWAVNIAPIDNSSPPFCRPAFNRAGSY